MSQPYNHIKNSQDVSQISWAPQINKYADFKRDSKTVNKTINIPNKSLK